MIKGKSAGEIITEVKIFKHLLSGKVFESKKDCENWAYVYEKHLIAKKRNIERKEELTKKSVIIDREICQELRKMEIHDKLKNEYVDNHKEVREAGNLINTHTLQMKKLQLAIELLKSSLINQKKSAKKEYPAFDNKALKSARARLQRVNDELKWMK